MAIAANTIARGRDHERNNSTTQDMCYPLVRNNNNPAS